MYIEQIRRELESVNTKLLLAQADYSAYVKRSNREIVEAILYGNTDLIRSVLFFLDDLERSIMHAETSGVDIKALRATFDRAVLILE